MGMWSDYRFNKKQLLSFCGLKCHTWYYYNIANMTTAVKERYAVLYEKLVEGYELV